MATRLSWWVEAKHLLREEQCGFHPHRSTLDVLAQKEYQICDTYRQRQVMTTLFVDIERAFDSAPHERVLYKLAKMGITGTTLVWVKNVLAGRSFQVAVGAAKSTPHPIQRGVPQGSILSPLLFNILLSDLHVPHHSHLLIYADDITIISRATTLTDSQHQLQEAATALERWMATWGLTVSGHKSALMSFTLKSLPTPPTVILNGTVVPYTRTHIFLGLRLEGPQLTWSSHINHLVTSCNKQLNISKRLDGIQ